MSKHIMWILIINFIVAIFLINNFSYKYYHHGKSLLDSDILNTFYKEPAIVNTIKKPVIIVKPKMVTSILKPVVPIQNSCVIYGPISNENKNTLDLLLTKSNILNSTNIISKSIYEIDWNLGKNKLVAISLFEKQKNNGPLKDEKFKLKLDTNGDWIVLIAEITANEKTAAITAKELEDKASHSNTGGKWLYKVKEPTYFYKFDNSNIIPVEVKGVMDKTFNMPKAICD